MLIGTWFKRVSNRAIVLKMSSGNYFGMFRTSQQSLIIQ